ALAAVEQGEVVAAVARGGHQMGPEEAGPTEDHQAQRAWVRAGGPGGREGPGGAAGGQQRGGRERAAEEASARGHHVGNGRAAGVYRANHSIDGASQRSVTSTMSQVRATKPILAVVAFAAKAGVPPLTLLHAAGLDPALL